MNDLISRSELIAKMENLKISLGDVILGFVVDRVIEQVREMPAANQPTEPLDEAVLTLLRKSGATPGELIMNGYEFTIDPLHGTTFRYVGKR